MAKAVKGLIVPSKAGAAAEKSANEADRAAHRKESGLSDQSVVPTKFATAAAEDTLKLMELGFEYVWFIFSLSHSILCIVERSCR